MTNRRPAPVEMNKIRVDTDTRIKTCLPIDRKFTFLYQHFSICIKRKFHITRYLNEQFKAFYMQSLYLFNIFLFFLTFMYLYNIYKI
jgi:hypothetical protein